MEDKKLYYRINLTTFEVKEVGGQEDVRSLPGVGHNGQHYQLPGEALVEWDGMGKFNLYHPNTCASTGHVDIYYHQSRRDGEYGVEILDYGCQELSINNLSGRWPTGGWNLICVIDAVEKHIQKSHHFPETFRAMSRSIQLVA